MHFGGLSVPVSSSSFLLVLPVLFPQGATCKQILQGNNVKADFVTLINLSVRSSLCVIYLV